MARLYGEFQLSVVLSYDWSLCLFMSMLARGVRVYPYPRVYPTRPVPAGMGRVRVGVVRVGSGTGTKSTGTGIPVFTRKNTIFHDVGYRMFFFISSF